MLALVTFEPTYVSNNTTTGQQDSLKFFPEDYAVDEEIPEGAPLPRRLVACIFYFYILLIACTKLFQLLHNSGRRCRQRHRHLRKPRLPRRPPRPPQPRPRLLQMVRHRRQRAQQGVKQLQRVKQLQWAKQVKQQQQQQAKRLLPLKVQPKEQHHQQLKELRLQHLKEQRHQQLKELRHQQLMQHQHHPVKKQRHQLLLLRLLLKLQQSRHRPQNQNQHRQPSQHLLSSRPSTRISDIQQHFQYHCIFMYSTSVTVVATHSSRPVYPLTKFKGLKRNSTLIYRFDSFSQNTVA